MLQVNPNPLPKADLTRLLSYLHGHGESPERYLADKFRTKDVIFLGEQHGFQHNLRLVQGMIPYLYRAHVYAIGMEFGAAENQGALDRLTSGPKYDASVARRLMFDYNVGWPFKEYMDVYRRAWEFNRKLKPGVRKFRIINLSYRFNWVGQKGELSAAQARQVFYRGDVEEFRANIVKKAILDRREKILILTGTPHAFTRYNPPTFGSTPSAYQFETRDFGNLVYRMAPRRTMTVLLHQPFINLALSGETFPANGAIDELMDSLGNPRMGFDLAGSLVGDLSEDSRYSIGHLKMRLGDLADGYIYEMPFTRYRGMTIDNKFLTRKNFLQAQRNFPDPSWHPRPNSLSEYVRRLTKEWGEVSGRMAKVR